VSWSVTLEELADLACRAWYDRLALVLMNHYNASPEEKDAKLREATQVCIDGLLDDETHLSEWAFVSHLPAHDEVQSTGLRYPAA